MAAIGATEPAATATETKVAKQKPTGQKPPWWL